MLKKLLLLSVTLLTFSIVSAQYSTRSLSKKAQVYVDSLKEVDYDYIFPVLGAKAYSLGFDVPYPFGMNLNQLYTFNDVIIDNIKLGFETPRRIIDPIDLSDVIIFGETTAEVYNVHLRPDLWIFPFLNVYGILGYSPYAKTSVTLTDPIELNSAPKQSGLTTGFGVTGAFGVGPLFIVLDGNWSWNDMELVKNPVQTKGFGFRLGHNFVNRNKPERALAIWGGAMRIKLQSDTKGSIRLGDAIDGDDTEVKQKLTNTRDRLQEIYDNTPNIGPGVDLRERLEGAINALDYVIVESPVQNTTISYELDKSLAQAWAPLVGGSYQFNKNWMVRYEVQFGKHRSVHLLALNYRFLGFHKPKSLTE